MRCSRLPKKPAHHKARHRLSAEVHRVLLSSYSSPALHVWLVDGQAVRDKHSVDFALAGHDRVYHYVPKGEVWLESGLSPMDRKFVLVHELWERRLMAGGLSYEAAHIKANKLEKTVRANPESVDTVLGLLVRQNS
jgi:hypothetical protein